VNDAAPTGLAYTTGTAFYTVGVPITANSPSSTGGAVTAYGVSPALPAGLSLSPSTGVITGTPTAVTAMASYTVTASNAAGSTPAGLTITVNAVHPAPPAGLAYSTSAPVYATGVPITANRPTSTGGAVTAYSASPLVPGGPAFPAGLSLDPGTGIVTGTLSTAPSTTAPPTTASYTVTAANAAGSTTATLTITMYNASRSGSNMGQSVPNMGQYITPLTPTNSSFEFLDTGNVVGDPFNTQVPPVEWLAGQAVSTVVSPDGKTLLVLTSGFNRVFQAESLAWDPALSTEYVFVYDITNGTPVKKQVVQIPNTYHGIVWDPSGKAFYVSSGMGDWPYDSSGDNVHIIVQNPKNGVWQSAGELALGHSAGNGIPEPNNGPASGVNASVFVNPCAAGVAISQDGQTLVVANYYNDSITIFTGGLGNWSSGTELDLRPGKSVSSPDPGTPGGEYPFGVVVAGGLNGASWTPYTAYVSSIRDREIDVVNVSGAPPSVVARIPVKGQPNDITLNKAQTLLYVAEDQSDTVDVIDLNPTHIGSPSQPGLPATLNTVVETIPVIAPPLLLSSLLAPYTGANTNSVTLSPDETQLYVTNGNLNNIAVVALSGTNPPSGDRVVGLIPTGWYPNSVSLSADGTWAYVVNSKSPTGANPDECYFFGPQGYPTCMPANEYNPQLTKAGLQSIPLVNIMSQFPALTTQVALNNRFSSTESADDAKVMAKVHQGVQHVIFIIKENRTYDQILGDLTNGSNGDPGLALFGEQITPNLHTLARTFVTLDNFLDTAEVSYDGWPWTTSARANDVVENQFPIQYAQRGLSLDGGGMNRSVNVAMPTVAQRQAGDPLMPDDPDLLPGQADVAAPDGPNNEVNTGYLWDAALRAGLTVRNYGFSVDTTCYNAPTCAISLAHDPASTGTIVAFPTSASLAPYTDPYFRGFDLSFPDFYRYKEWERDFDANYATTGRLPNLSLVRLMHDHTGSFSTAIDLVNTPDRDQADNDYAVGLLVQKIAGSMYANNTLIFVVEDDAQDGGDHVDSHRSPAFVVGAYVKQGVVVSTRYNTLDLVRTMEEVLGIPPMTLNDALATPMTDIFNTTPSAWSFTATPAAILYCTNLPLPPPAQPCTDPTPNAAYWARVTEGLDFTDADRLDGALYNRILWKGLMGDKPYPAAPTGIDLRQNREELLARYRLSLKQEAAQEAKAVRD
jgi:DNA-binding beta-propeller fold protein YncE